MRALLAGLAQLAHQPLGTDGLRDDAGDIRPVDESEHVAEDDQGIARADIIIESVDAGVDVRYELDGQWVIPS